MNSNKQELKMTTLKSVIKFLYLTAILCIWVMYAFHCIEGVKFQNLFFSGPNIINLCFSLIVVAYTIRRFWCPQFYIIFNIIVDGALFTLSIIVGFIEFIINSANI
jgi:hypothetical protein